MKIGDKIKCKQTVRTYGCEVSNDPDDALFYKGYVGRIVGKRQAFDDFLVEFNAPVRTHKRGPVIGHDGNNLCDKKTTDGHGWYLSKEMLDKYFEKV